MKIRYGVVNPTRSIPCPNCGTYRDIREKDLVVEKCLWCHDDEFEITIHQLEAERKNK